MTIILLESLLALLILVGIVWWTMRSATPHHKTADPNPQPPKDLAQAAEGHCPLCAQRGDKDKAQTEPPKS